jgi:putative hemolysin|tara:strand:- start:845 stop:1735 length:891 start_codon:yes stop_codon:yes gene_type:complete
MVSQQAGLAASPDCPVKITARQFLARLAESDGEVQASQRLRFQVFCEEMSAKPSDEMLAQRREFDAYDAYCDHLLIFDVSQPGEEGLPGRVVATYRFLRREKAAAAGGFYSANEYDVSALEALEGELMELGRSCVHADHRSGVVMQLLWRGIADYVFYYNIVALFGCASFQGVDLQTLRLPLSYLYHYHLAPEEMRARTRERYYNSINLMAKQDIDVKQARKELPPLLKGYLRLGGFIGDGAFIDPEFGTTDVCVVVPTETVTNKYLRHFTRKESVEEDLSDKAATDLLRETDALS